MSQVYVRNTLMTDLQALLTAQVPSVPLYNTLNQQQKPTDPLWATVVFYAPWTEPVCYAGTQRIEFGSIDIDVFGKAGKGDTPVMTLADTILNHYFNNELTNDLQITDATPAGEFTAGDASPYYGVTVSLEYQYFL